MNEPQASTSTGSSASRPASAGAGSSSSSVDDSEDGGGSKGPWTFDYIVPGPDWLLTPIVDITVAGPGLPMSTMAVIDSGADSSALPLSYAEELGIDLEKDCHVETGMSSGGASQQRIYTPGLAAEVFGRRFRMTAVFTDTPLILLGQEDFFMQFHVAFDRRGAKVTLRAY